MKNIIVNKKAQVGALIYWICFFIIILLLFISIFKLNAPSVSKFIIVILLAGLSAYFRSKHVLINMLLVGIGGLMLSLVTSKSVTEFFVILILFIAFYYLFKYFFKKGYFSWGK